MIWMKTSNLNIFTHADFRFLHKNNDILYNELVKLFQVVVGTIDSPQL